MKIDFPKLRTCKYNDKDYLFHCWEHFSEIIEPSLMIGGHTGGIIGCTFAIIENSKGEVYRVPAYEIRFTDNIFREYCFEDMTDERRTK